MTKMTAKLNGLNETEKMVVRSIVLNADSVSGGDFAILDETHVPGLNRKQLGGYVSTLERKGIISVDECRVNGAERVVQITFSAEVAAMFGSSSSSSEPEGMDDGTQNPENGVAPETAEPVEPSLPKSLLEGERSMRMTEYRNLLGRAQVEITASIGDFEKRGYTHPHHGANLLRTAADLQALASVIESLSRTIDSCR